MYGGERPRAGWAEILLLAERLGPTPPLIPDDESDRVLMFGLAHEILGELGLIWCRRLIGLAPHQEARPNDVDVSAYRYKYGSSRTEVNTAMKRVADVLDFFPDGSDVNGSRP